MNRLILPLFVIVLLALPGRSEQPAVLKIHLIGVGEYEPAKSLAEFKSHLEQNYRVECSASFQLKGNQLENLDRLKSSELMLLFAQRMVKLPEEQMAIFRQHWESGKPIVALRTASHAFNLADNEVFDRKVLGGNYNGKGTPKLALAEGAADHPILKGVKPFTSKYGYGQGQLADDVQVLLSGKQGSGPLSWVHTYKGGRVFYTAGGGPEDFQDENFRRLLTNAVFWTTQRDPDKMKK